MHCVFLCSLYENSLRNRRILRRWRHAEVLQFEVNSLRIFMRTNSATFDVVLVTCHRVVKLLLWLTSPAKRSLLKIIPGEYSYKCDCSGKANTLVALYLGISQRRPSAGRWIAASCEIVAQVAQNEFCWHSLSIFNLELCVDSIQFRDRLKLGWYLYLHILMYI